MRIAVLSDTHLPWRGQRSLPGLDSRVRVPSEPSGLRQNLEVLGREGRLRVSLAERIESLVPCMPTVRIATLLNAILDELTHLAPCRPGMAPPYDCHGNAR